MLTNEQMDEMMAGYEPQTWEIEQDEFYAKMVQEHESVGHQKRQYDCPTCCEQRQMELEDMAAFGYYPSDDAR